MRDLSTVISIGVTIARYHDGGLRIGACSTGLASPLGDTAEIYTRPSIPAHATRQRPRISASRYGCDGQGAIGVATARHRRSRAAALHAGCPSITLLGRAAQGFLISMSPAIMVNCEEATLNGSQVCELPCRSVAVTLYAKVPVG
jgi:hypothetical protein